MYAEDGNYLPSLVDEAYAQALGNVLSHASDYYASTGLQLNLRYVDGTCVEALERNDLRRDNTSGHTGVVKLKNGWSARIGFKGRSYYLGCYRDYDLAVAAREQAEEQLHHAFLDWYYQTYPSQEHKRKQTPSAAGTGYAAAAGEDPGFQLQGASQTVV